MNKRHQTSLLLIRSTMCTIRPNEIQPHQPTNQPTNEPNNQPTQPNQHTKYQPTNQINQPTKPTYQPTNQQPTNQTNQPAKPTKPTNKHTNQPIKPTRQPTKSINQTNQSTNQSINQPTPSPQASNATRARRQPDTHLSLHHGNGELHDLRILRVRLGRTHLKHIVVLHQKLRQAAPCLLRPPPPPPIPKRETHIRHTPDNWMGVGTGGILQGVGDGGRGGGRKPCSSAPLWAQT